MSWVLATRDPAQCPTDVIAREEGERHADKSARGGRGGVGRPPHGNRLNSDGSAGADGACRGCRSYPKVQQHCMHLLDKLRPGQEISEVMRSTCLTDASSVALYCDDPLATFYQDVNYGGRRLTFCGNYGTCDRAGYGFRHIGAFPADAASSSLGSTRLQLDATLWIYKASGAPT
jgi:hypothetical protein